MTLTLFTNVPVVPVTRVHQHVARGGPIWPGFAGQTWVRHCRVRKPWDEKPDLPPQLRPMTAPAVWGGFLDSHFGHFVADHLPRLAFSMRERPADTYLFTVDPGMTRADLARWVWQVFDWIGLSPDQVHLVTEPMYVETLRVGPQAEMLAQVGPVPGYLDAIVHWAAGLQPLMAPVVYVTRLGLPQKGGGAHAGEGYLVQQLQQAGVAVLNPSHATVLMQMQTYAGAGRLIFAEGSALHGRQLLGYVSQNIEVLRRRPDRMIAKAALRPRCDGLSYHDLTAGRLMAYWKQGSPRPDPALCLYDVAALIRIFQGLGIDLADAWNNAAYQQAARADIADWMQVRDPAGGRSAEHQGELARLDLGKT